MSCNWELYELRVIIWTTVVAPRQGGYLGAGVKFFNVYPDLLTLGVADFQGSNDYCDFKTVFNQLIKLKRIPFACRKKENEGNGFSRMQNAERDNEFLPAAKLYVCKRPSKRQAHLDHEFDVAGQTTGLGILMEEVFVQFLKWNNNAYYIDLVGNSASPINY